MFCPKCGNPITENAKFCPGCGYRTRGGTRAGAQPPPRREAQPPPLPQGAAGSGGGGDAPDDVDEEEEEEVLPPPTDGALVFNFQANDQGRMVQVKDPPKGDPPPFPGGGEGEHSGGTATADAAHGHHGGPEDVVLPPAGEVWNFREGMTRLADKVVGGMGANAGTNPALGGLTRLIRAFLLDRRVFRSTAANSSLMTEAIIVTAAIIVLSTIGLRFGSLFGYGSSIVVKIMVIRAASWVGAVFAVQLAARSFFKIDLPPAAWFRAMVYGQGVLVFGIVPALLAVLPIWAAVCTAAALQDVTGKGIKEGIILLVVAGVSSAVLAAAIGAVWL